MSSKSRKQPRKEAKDPRPTHAASAAAEPAPAEHGLDIPEKYLKAPPRKMSRLTWGFLVFMLIFLLIVFVGGNFGSFGSPGSGDAEFMTWNRPGHGRVAVMESDFRKELDAFQKAFQIDPLMPFFLGISDSNLGPEDLARLLVLSQVAEDEGIVITDEDLGQHLAQALQFSRIPPESYQQVARALGGAESIERTLRRGLLAMRFMQLVSFAGAVPTQEGVEALWNEEHEELAFDYVEAAAADLADEAQAELPDDAALEAWLTEQGPAEREAFELPERRSVEVASFRDPTLSPAAGLLQAFPPAEGTDPEERANEYYGRVAARRFLKAEPDAGPPTEEGALPQFKTFEEVREACLVEAPIYEALQAWLADLQARQTAGTAIDLAAEAAQHGLSFVNVPASTQAELEASSELGGKAFADVAFFTPPASFAYTVTASPDRIGIVRVVERLEPTLPPFAEIRAAVAARWVEVRSAALAEEKLRGIWSAFEVLESEASEEQASICRRSSEDAFRAAVEGLGLQVARRDWLDKGGNPGADPEREERAHQFLARNPEYLRLLTDEVAEPRASDDGEHVYLVRLAGKRPVSLDLMGPGQYAQLKERARQRNYAAFDFAFLEETYGVTLPPSRDAAAEGDLPEEGPAEDAEEEGASPTAGS